MTTPMEQSPKQQAIELIKSAKTVLVMGHQGGDGDSLGSTVALTLALRKLGKQVQGLASDPVPGYLQFLPTASELTDTIGKADSDFVISVDTSAVEIDKLGYKNHADERKLNIVIKTKSGQLEPGNVSFGESGPQADLIIVLDTNDIERVGSLYTKYQQLFYKTPIINIDHHPGNAYFGKVNWVDLAATSTAEILVSLVEALSQTPREDGSKGNLLDADIATALLTGLTTDTGSFQNTNTTPKSFTVAAQLVASGARQQEIVQHIYKTKPLSTLKLWGKILSNIQFEPDHRFVYSTASAADLSHFGAAESETSGVIDELLKTVPGIDFALLLSEKHEGLYGSFRGVNPEVSVSEIAGLFAGGGHKMAAAFRLPGGSLADNEAAVIDKIKAYQKGERPSQPTTPAPTSPSEPTSLESIEETSPVSGATPATAGTVVSPTPLASSTDTADQSTKDQATIPTVESLLAEEPAATPAPVV